MAMRWIVAVAGLIALLAVPARAGGGVVYTGQTGTIGTGTAGKAAVSKWDGSAWTAVATIDASSSVRALAMYNLALWVGGSFTVSSSSEAIPLNGLAIWDGSYWVLPFDTSAIYLSPTSSVYAMTTYNGALYIGGDFSVAGASTVAANLCVWVRERGAEQRRGVLGDTNVGRKRKELRIGSHPGS